MKRLLVRILAGIGALALLLAAALVAVVYYSERPPLPDALILELDLAGEYVEAAPDDTLARALLRKTGRLRDIVDGLDRAASDDRVRALVTRIGGSNLGLAKIQEIRDAVTRFRATGKPAIAWAESYGEFGPGTLGYYLATAFDEVYLLPTGEVGATGLTFVTRFLRGALDKLEIKPRLDHRREYKNAMNVFTERAYTPAHREAVEAVMRSQFDQIVAGIAAARGIDEETVREIFDRGPYYGEEAVQAGLVDALRYRDEVYAEIRDRHEGAELLYLERYLQRAGRPHRKGQTIALIYGVGAIARGESRMQGLGGGLVMGSDTVSGAFRAAIEDDDVAAILFRVDSPGGSAVASDVIWRETQRAREAGKPVIVSMSDVAGSGGYWVAMGADRIVAQPGTITGSIGVLAGKLVTRDFWGKLGITYDKTQTSRHGTMYSSVYDYTPEEWERLQAALDHIYETFKARVAAGRHLSPERVEEIARGRIWTGAQALELGLVDALGGMDEALKLARREAGMEADAAVRLKVFPRPRPPLEDLLGEGRKNSEDYALVEALQATAAELAPVLDLARRLGITAGPEDPVLRMPWVPVPSTSSHASETRP